MNQLKEQNLYCIQMQEIINRDGLIKQLLSGEKTLGSEFYDYEVFALNMRKILELIAFASVIATKNLYALKHKNFDEHYKAKAILKEVESIHPEFFPTPTSIKEMDDGTKHMSLPTTVTNALTKREFEELYDMCTKVIHVWKPYNPKPKEVNFRLSPIDWLNKVRDLLNIHYVHLPQDGGIWLCRMKDPEDKKPHVYTLKPVN